MKGLSFLWRWSLVLTLPLAILFGMWAPSVYSRWQDYGLRHLTMENFSLMNVGRLEADHMMRAGQVSAHRLSLPDAVEASGLRSMQMYISDPSLSELNDRLPASGFEYTKASLVYNGGLHPVKVRYRGDSSYHWGYWKRSWRIKTDRSELLNGMRKFNWIAPRTPELFNNHLGHRLADRMGLIAPKSEVVPVSINGNFAGIYALTEQMEESTLRRAGRMPGDVYAGDVAGRDGYTGLDIALFDRPGAWRKIAINNHFPEGARDPLVRLLQLVRSYESPEAQAELSTLLDMRAFATFSVFESLAATVHYDITHNWRLFYDPWETKFVPMLWDPVGWHKDWRPKPSERLRTDVISSPMHMALFHNADFLRERERVLHDFYTSGRDKAFLIEVNELRRAVDPLLEHDADIVANMQVLGPERIRKALSQMEQVIGDLFARLKQSHLGGTPDAVTLSKLGGHTWGVKVAGRRQITQLEFQFDGPLDGVVDCTVAWDAGGVAMESDVSGNVAAGVDSASVALGLLGKFKVVAPSMVIADTPRNHLNVTPGYYELTLNGLPEGLELLGVTSHFVDGTHQACTWSDFIEPIDMGLTRQLVPANPGQKATVWDGEITLSGNQTLKDLIIKPGTKVRCMPGANLLVEGRLIAEGTEESPIEFAPAEVGQDPWGCLIIKSAGANGSRLTHCRFVGGSGWKRPMAEYSAMVSVHSVQDVRFQDCSFESSKVVDDMVHGVYSSIVFKDCRFIDSLSDALDMDISDVTVDGCLFERSGNDALDLMTSSAAIVNTVIVASGDKGISVGERSKVFMLQSSIRQCAIGMQPKDDSVALVINCDFIDNQLSVDAYKKNWRYDGGGFGKLLNCVFIGSGETLKADKYSILSVDGSYFSEEVVGLNLKRVLIGPDVVQGPLSRKLKKVRKFAIGSSVKDWELEGEHFLRHAEQVRIEARGRTGSER